MARHKVNVVTFTVEGLTIALIDGSPDKVESHHIAPVINRNRVVLQRNSAGVYTVVKDNIGVGRTLTVAEVKS